MKSVESGSVQWENNVERDPKGLPLRVVHLVDSLRVGGKERQICELLKGLRDHSSIESIVVTMGSEQFYVPQIRELGVPLFYLLRRVRWDPTVFSRLFRLLRTFAPHIIHTNSEMAMSYAWPIARSMGIKVINGTIRNAFSGSGLRWQWHKAMLTLADARVANSVAGFRSRGLNPSSPGNHVIYNGLEMSRFPLGNQKDAACLGFDTEGRKVIGMVAEFSDYKDFPTFIRAAQLLLSHRNDVVFVAVGDGKNFESCRSMVFPGEKWIRFLGQRTDVDSVVSQMDVGVLCTFSEGLSNSIMEFMAAGKPVVVTGGGGSSELIVDGEHGFLTPVSQPAAVAAKIEFLLDNPEAARQMGRESRKRIQHQFSLEALSDKTAQIYRSLVPLR